MENARARTQWQQQQQHYWAHIITRHSVISPNPCTRVRSPLTHSRPTLPPFDSLHIHCRHITAGLSGTIHIYQQIVE